ncbi:DUF559 domain-containing protein [bacterium]|nr:DUF559 domain-containing protein [Candidatus Omnitrophota bacterium]MBU3929324.1 DUF559 domain-containing protein [bacterium]MBU4122699.1 DUF559 domain-containing protein [bacterium]
MEKLRPDVLVCVLKTNLDRRILLEEKWYRVPLAHAPRRKPKFLAFYQGASFKDSGERIELYGRIKYWRLKKRKEILPEEKGHPRANDTYLQFFLSSVSRLRRPVLNRARLRISFGFTSLEKLRREQSIRGLFDIPPMDDILEAMLRKNKIPFKKEFIVKRKNAKIFRLDFALIGSPKPIDVECDGYRWHSRKQQRIKDKLRDEELKKLGWKIIRISEEDLLKKPSSVLKKIKKSFSLQRDFQNIGS